MTTQTRSILAVALAAFALACVDATSPSKLVSNAPSATITQESYFFPPGFPDGLPTGTVRLCKTANEGGTFSFTVATADGTGPIVTAPSITIPAGGGTVCQDVYTSNLGIDLVDSVTITEGADPSVDWDLTAINTIRYMAQGPLNNGNYPAVAFTDGEDFANRKATVVVNLDMSRKVTFTNTFTAPPPPPEICDFITFGRLVWENGGLKVVISGNAGGNKPGGGILGEFHIEVNGVDHHVADIVTYGPITNNPLISSTYTNSRVVTGIDKDGHAVELRLWDGGEPGKGTDRFWFNVNGTIVGNAVTGNLIDQGNMQYHPVCRGPDDID
jgi:hypothetical protein